MKILNNLKRMPLLGLGGIMLAAAAWKALLLAMNLFPFNADEAVVALMARHILQGERPIFFYGQAYMGSLDAFLVAAGFWLFGEQVWVIRLVQALLYLGLIATTAAMGRQIFGRWREGLAAAVLLAIPTVNFTLYTTVSLGGYGEALLLGNLILLLTLRIDRGMAGHSGISLPMAAAAWGFCAGLGLWANGLTLIYSLPAALFLIYRVNRKAAAREPWALTGWLALAPVGFLLGAMPWWLYAVSAGWQSLLGELFGRAVAVEQGPWVIKVLSHALSFILLGGTVTFGLRPPWEVRWLAAPLLPFTLVVWAGVAVIVASALIKTSGSRRAATFLWSGVVLTLATGFIFTSFGVDPSGRYFLPLAVPLALAAGFALFRVCLTPVWRAAGLAVLLLFQGWGTLQCALTNPPGITTQFNAITQVDTGYQQELIDFLTAQGETRGYSNYWVAYPTAFLSREQIILSPALPYHADLRYTARDNRYMPYQRIVAASTKTAYVTTHNPALDEQLGIALQRLDVTWQERQIGDYHVFYQLSRAVTPVDLGLRQ